MKINFCNRIFDIPTSDSLNLHSIHEYINHSFNLKELEYSLRSKSGRILLLTGENKSIEECCEIYIHLNICGGKGGFGANLRRQGAKMGKNVTNFESCRDLSGRRLRTLNEAQRLVDAVDKEKEKRKEREEKLEKKIREGLEMKKPISKKFEDVSYFQSKEKISEDLKDAIYEVVNDDSAGSNESSTSSSSAAQKKPRKKFTWNEDDDSTSEEDEQEARK